MNNIDFIKWKVGLAKGFEIKGEFVSVLSQDALWSFEELINDEILSSFLIQRSCEYCGVYLRKHGSYFTAHYYDYREFPQQLDPDKAKESALKYIFEQEKEA